MEVGRDVTDEQRGRRPIFIATLRAGASWPFFCVALSARMIQIWALVRALKNSQLTSGKIYVISETGHQLEPARYLGWLPPSETSALQLFRETDVGFQHAGNGTQCLGLVGNLVKLSSVDPRYPPFKIKMDRCDRPVPIHLIQCERRFRRQLIRRESRRAQECRKGHREATGVSRRNQLLRIRANPIFEAGGE
jgi:hypothetical protein